MSLARYKIIFPAEHGSWSMMLTPFIIGAGVAGEWSAAILLCFAAVMALFLARQPVSLWLRIRRGTGRAEDSRPAAVWSAILLGIAALAGIGLLALGRLALLWLALAALGVLIATLIVQAVFRPRQLWIEIIGVIGLALAAPAAHIAAANRLDGSAWLAYAISALHNIISVLYVRLRIDLRHGRASSGEAWGVTAAHLLALAGVIGAALLGYLPLLVIAPVAGLTIRALYVAWRRPGLEHVRRFGFVEMGLALAFALIVV